jgi:hypothetical protein
VIEAGNIATAKLKELVEAEEAGPSLLRIWRMTSWGPSSRPRGSDESRGALIKLALAA